MVIEVCRKAAREKHLPLIFFQRQLLEIVKLVSAVLINYFALALLFSFLIYDFLYITNNLGNVRSLS